MIKLDVVRCRAIVLLTLTAVILWILYHRDPRLPCSYPPCLFHFLTRLYCPGCGSARAIYSLLHTQILTAIDYNIFLVMSLPILGYAVISEFKMLLTGKGLPQIHLNTWSARAIVVGLLLFWILRNIPVYPFTMLAP